MKTNLLSVSMTGEAWGQSLFQKLIMVSMIAALMLALLPVQGAHAASGGPIKSELAKEWKDKVDTLNANGLFYQRVRIYPADFKDPAEHARAWELLHKYGSALRAAQTVVLNRTGFDENGRVLNEIKADRSVKELAAYLQEMRGIQKKLDALEGEYTLLPLSVLYSLSASQ